MTGITGGTVSGDALSEMAGSLYREEWYETKMVSEGDVGMALVQHGDKDPLGNTLWLGEEGIGVLHGVIANEETLPWDLNEVYDRLLSEPDEILRELEGPFVLAWCGAGTGEIHLATDKIGSRPCYYTENDGFFFGSELKPLLPRTADPSVDVQAVSDLLLTGYVMGERTLIEGISNLPPATHLTYADGEVTLRKYWKASFEPRSEREYADEWIDRYRTAMRDVSGTIEGRMGLWLSGGLDSRVAAATLKDVGREFDTLTYRNKNGRNPGPAKEVARRLDVNNVLLNSGTARDFVAGIEKGIDTTDGMTSWAYLANISFLFSSTNRLTDVVMEGGTFLGEHVWQHHLTDDRPPEDVVYDLLKGRDTESVRSFVNADVDPKASIRDLVASSGRTDPEEAILDSVQLSYACSHMRSNVAQRSQVGTRTLADGRMLDHYMGMPRSLRMDTLPFTDGKIPFGVPKLKLEVTRKIGHGMDAIDYDRTALAPARPALLQTIGFGLTQVADRLRDRRTGQYLAWYRENDEVRAYIDGLLADARDRPFLNADAIGSLRAGVLSGESDDIRTIAAITGLERWLQTHVDALDAPVEAEVEAAPAPEVAD